MKSNRIDIETLLEGGLFVLGVSLLVGLVLYGGGWLSGQAHRQRGRSAPAPEPGTVSKRKHQNIGSVSTR